MIISAAYSGGTQGDLYWSRTVFLLKNINLNGATNNSFRDDGPYKFLPTRNGDVAQGSFSPFSGTVGDAPPQIGGSVWFDGTGDYLTGPSTSGQLGSGDFTVEGWVFPLSRASSYNCIWNNYSTYGTGSLGIFAGHSSGNTAKFQVSCNGATFPTIQSAADIAYNQWTHLAVVRSSGVITLYVNGVVNGTYSTTATLDGAGSSWIGTSGDYITTGYFNGHISNFRVVKGTAVYTAAFKPPTAPLTAVAGTSLLTCQSATAITDASSNAFTISRFGDVRAVSDSPFGYGSVYFDGSGDTLTVSDNTTLNMGIGDYTWELWFYATVDGWSCLMEKGLSSGGTTHGIWIANGKQLFYSGGPTIYGTAGKVALNAWNHAAVTRASGVVKLWLNGSLEGSASDSTDYTTTGSALSFGGRVAGHPNGQYPLTGYVSNARIVKGSAVYTSAFTPPTAPLTAITGTSLLTCQDKGSIVDASTNSFTVTRVGDARPDRMTPFAQKAAGYWSNYFDGSGDCLTTTNNTQTDFGTGDFTIECWFNTSAGGRAGGGGGSICGKYNGSTGGDWGFELGVNTVRDVSFYNGNSLVFASPTNVFSAGQWNHLALVRASGTMTAYINGSSVYSKTVTDSLSSTGAGSFSIGYANGGSATFNGYLSNLRIVKGSAVYTGTFTPPVAPLTAVAGTSLLTCQDNRFRDNSANNFTITKYGDTSVSRFNPFGPSLPAPTVNLASAGSVYFDGSGDRITVPNNTALNMGTGDFTWECWFNCPDQSSIRTLMYKGSSTGAAGGVGALTMGIMVSGNQIIWSGGPEYWSTGTWSAGVWNHVAITRSGTSLKIWINGSAAGSFTDSVDYTNTSVASVGDRYASHPYGQYPFLGNISNARIVKGTAVYTAAFTPSTSPLTAISGTSLLTAQDAVTVTDASSNNFTVTKEGDAKAVEASPFKRVSTVYGGSGYFDGSGDYLALGASSAFGFGSGDFTMECWFYKTGTNLDVLLDTRVGAGGYANGMALYVHSNTLKAGGSTELLSGGTVTSNTWNHCAVVRYGNTLSLYLNGVKTATAAFSTTLASSCSPYIGNSVVNEYANGYISNARIVKGVALYTANFDPPVSPVSAVGGTSLLLNFDNAGIYDATTGRDIGFQASGTAKVSSTVTQFAKNTIYFDGSANSCLSIPDSPDLRMGTGDFTIETWFYPTNYTLSVLWYRGSAVSGTTQAIVLNAQSSGSVQYNGAATTNGTAYTLNAWNHVAVSRTSGSTKLFLNGTQIGSTLSDTTDYNLAERLTIGDRYPSHPYSNYPFTGYVSEFRVTKGVGRYTTNFTPSSSESPTRSA